MELLHLVPYALLTVVATWLVWPMIADPIRARVAAKFHPDAPSPDGVADSLFGAWSDEQDTIGSGNRTA